MVDRLVGAGGTLDSAWGLRHETSSMRHYLSDPLLPGMRSEAAPTDRFAWEEVDQSGSLLAACCWCDSLLLHAFLEIWPNKWASLGSPGKLKSSQKLCHSLIQWKNVTSCWISIISRTLTKGREMESLLCMVCLHFHFSWSVLKLAGLKQHTTQQQTSCSNSGPSPVFLSVGRTFNDTLHKIDYSYTTEFFVFPSLIVIWWYHYSLKPISPVNHGRYRFLPVVISPVIVAHYIR